MGMEAKGFEWTCDWCRSKVNNNDGEEMPDGWTTPHANNDLTYLEHGVFCKEACCVNYVKLDQLLGVLYGEVERTAMHHFKGHDVPAPPAVRILMEVWNENVAKQQPDYKPGILEPPNRP